MWIYVLCSECGRDVDRARVQGDIGPVIPIEMDDGGIAADILECLCESCWAATESHAA